LRPLPRSADHRIRLVAVLGSELAMSRHDLPERVNLLMVPG
jgi:hypothetical protein